VIYDSRSGGDPLAQIETDSDTKFDRRDAGSNGSAKMPRSAKQATTCHWPSAEAQSPVSKHLRVVAEHDWTVLAALTGR
jgi:hypothetical protein